MIEKATSYGQVLAADWGFVCLKLADDQCIQQLLSYYGESSCYLLFTCTYSGALFGVCSASKAVPVAWLDSFFYCLSHSIHDGN
jgi:hypothetical protein